MSKKKRIFISRQLAENSPIRKAAQDHILIGQSLIRFSSLEFEIPEADWIFFYSRNAVRFFFENSNFELYPYQYACLSYGTADELSNYVIDISFVGNGKPMEVAKSFQNIRKPSESVCFIRANNSVDSVHNLMKSENTFSIPVYNNEPIEEVPNEDFDILIFTSPMNVDAWFGKNEYRDQKIIAIGYTTRNAVSKHVSQDVLVADEPSEDGLARILESIV